MPLHGAYELLRPAQADAIIRETGIVYLPWGALEWHSLQNPVGLDALKIHRLALDCAAVTGGVVVPVVYAGYQTMKPHAGFRHTLEVPAEVVAGLANAYFDQLADEGYRLLVLMMGHFGGEHVKNLRFTAENWERYRAKGNPMRIWAFPEYEVIIDDGYSGDHAGAYETSLLMHYLPDLVDLSQLPAEGDLDGKALGLSGADPRTEASAEHGKLLAELIVKRIAEGVAARLAQPPTPPVG